jgi:isopenicillin N synthase-like dioxygenase
MNRLIREIPYVDLSELLSGSISPKDFLKLVHQYGFVYFYNLDFNPFNLNSQILKKLEIYADNFFSLPLEKKMKYYIGNSFNHRGYVPLTEKGAYSDEQKRVYEAFDMSYPENSFIKEEHQKLRGQNIWPQEIPEFKKSFEKYYNKMFLLGKALLRIFSESFDLPTEYFENSVKHPPAQLRLLHYLPNHKLVGKEDVAMGGHTDYELFTLLHQTSPGIQGYLDEEGKFFNLPVFKNTLLMVVGDMMHFMTNGYLKSFYHRVINNGMKRLSFPFFMNLDFETELKILPKFKNFNAKKQNIKNFPESIVVGHHLLGQLYRDFPYIKERIDQGEWKIPFDIPKHNIFERREKNEKIKI